MTWMFAADGAAGYHLSGDDCSSCHLGSWSASSGQASRLIASQEYLCEICHRNVRTVSHASGFRPGRPLPPEYPLDWKGDMTCSTCHLPHGNQAGLLRGTKRGKDFCLACHTPEFFSAMKDAGASIVESGHLQSSDADRGLDGLDSYSLNCMRCHIGKSGKAAPVSVGMNLLRHDGGRINHPIGSSYREAAKFGGYRPVQRLSKKILLPGGRLSCLSCHLGYSMRHGQLAVSNNRSALCFECHEK